MKPIDDGRCFVCGPHNPIGLHLRFERSNRGVQARTTLPDSYQGWQGMAHGGIAIALLDEAMAHAAGFAGYRGLTARVTARFRRPVPLGAPLRIEGRVAWVRRNALGLEASVCDADGNVLLEGEGSFISGGRIEESAQ